MRGVMPDHCESYLHAPPLSSSICHLAIGEYASARMPFSQRRRSAQLAEIGCPSPVPDLRHIFQVLSNVVVMFVESSIEHVHYVRSLGTQPGTCFSASMAR